MLLAAQAMPALAVDVAVSNLDDSGAGSLRAAVTAANSGDRIVFDPSLASGTLTLVSKLSDIKSVTFVNAESITLTGTSSSSTFRTLLPILDGATLSGTLPKMSFTATAQNTTRSGVYSSGDLTLADPVSGAITVNGEGTNQHVSAIYASRGISLGDITAALELTSENYNAKAVRALNDDIAMRDFTGSITLRVHSSGHGMEAGDNLSMRNLEGSIDITSGSSGYGARAGEDLSIDNITGSIKIDSENYGHGISSGDDMDIDTISGTITVDGENGSAYGLYSGGSLNDGAGGSVAISGTVSAHSSGDDDEVAALYAREGMKVEISGTVKGTASDSGTPAYSIYSTNAFDDTITLGSGATVTGKIDLDGGTNLLSMVDAGTLSGAMANITTLSKSGAGTWNTTGDIATTDLNVSAGMLKTEGEIDAANVTVSAGTTLKVTVLQAANPTVDATNTVTNDGDVIFDINGSIPRNQTVTILSSANPLAGGGTYSVMGASRVTLDQTANNITVTKGSYASGIVVGRGNTLALAEALDAAADAGSTTGAMDDLLAQADEGGTDAELSNRLGQLSNPTLTGLSAMSVGMAQLASQATQARMTAMRAYQTMLAENDNSMDPDDPETWPLVAAIGDLSGLFARSPEFNSNGVHLRMVGTTGTMTSHGGYDSYNYDSMFLTGGYDQILSDNFMLGVSGGYSQTAAEFNDAGGSDSSMETYNVGVYGTWFQEKWYLEAVLSGAYSKYDTHRQIAFAGDTANSTPTGHTLSAKTSGGYRFMFHDFGLRPMASVEYTRFYQGGYTESDAGAANLSVESLSSNYLETGLGGMVDHVWDVGFGRIVPEVSVMWLHELLTQKRDVTYSMAGMPGVVYPQTMAESANDSLRVGAGLRFMEDDGLSLNLRYQGEFEEYADSHGIMFEFQIVF